MDGSDLTLGKAETCIRQSETVHLQQFFLWRGHKTIPNRCGEDIKDWLRSGLSKKTMCSRCGKSADHDIWSMSSKRHNLKNMWKEGTFPVGV